MKEYVELIYQNPGKTFLFLLGIAWICNAIFGGCK